MATPSQELLDVICDALIKDGIASDKEIASLQARILAGKIKAEDWYLAVENSLVGAVQEANNGN